MIRRAVVVALVLVACGCGGSADRATSTPTDELPVIEPFSRGGVEFTAADGTVTCSCVLVADTGDERAQGLMNVTDLQGFAGMVFVFDEDVTSQFFMRDTPMPLSIAWIAADGSLVSTADMDPCLDGGDCVSYPADGPYRFALEVPQGDLAAVGAVEGARFGLVEDCPT
jgi:uncharacterized membrane protein (UPF0127 family)